MAEQAGADGASVNVEGAGSTALLYAKNDEARMAWTGLVCTTAVSRESQRRENEW